MASLPLGLNAYRCAAFALAPLAPLVLRERRRRGKEDPLRLAERLGHAGLARPPGTLVWIHGASVGETLAALPLIEALRASTQCAILVTSGTVSSARLMRERLPAGVIHQFAPVDTPGAVKRFLDHWRPAAALFVDSEIWPNMVLGAHGRGVRLALINGRMSERSFKGWQLAKRSAATLLSRYDLVLAQDRVTAARLTALGARQVRDHRQPQGRRPAAPRRRRKIRRPARGHRRPAGPARRPDPSRRGRDHPAGA